MLSNCGRYNSNSNDEAEELAQQAGETMASIDDSGGSGGTLAWNLPNEERVLRESEKLFARHGQDLGKRPGPLASFLPNANAATCLSQPGFGSCSSNTLIRNFAGCTIGFAAINGTVTYTWATAAANCVLTGTGGTITRVPNFTVTGLRTASLSVYGTASIGQRLTLTGGAGVNKVFSFSNDGIRRVFTLNSTTLFDFTTETTSNITVTGTSRSNRVVSGGVLKTTNNKTGVTCNHVPTAVSWSANCNCATSGSWASTCSDGNNGNVTITGCGTGTYSFGTTSGSIYFDRCYSTI